MASEALSCLVSPRVPSLIYTRPLDDRFAVWMDLLGLLVSATDLKAVSSDPFIDPTTGSSFTPRSSGRTIPYSLDAV